MATGRAARRRDGQTGTAVSSAAAPAGLLAHRRATLDGCAAWRATPAAAAPAASAARPSRRLGRAHLALYPCGLLASAADRASRYPGRALGPGAARPAHRRRRGRGDADPAGARHGRQPLDLHVLRRGLRRRGFGRVMTHQLHPGDRTTSGRRARARWPRSRRSSPRPATSGSTSSGTAWAAWSRATTCSGSAATSACTRWSRSARRTPGTLHGPPVPHPLCRQLRPGSDLLAELAEPAPTCRTRFVAYWSDLDQMIVPHATPGSTTRDLIARNVLVRGVGHMSLPLDGRSCTRSPPRSPSWTPTGRRSAPASPRCWRRRRCRDAGSPPTLGVLTTQPSAERDGR